MTYPVKTELVRALMSKGYSFSEAFNISEDMKQEVAFGADPEEVLYDEGLEPDYIFDLIDIK